MTCFKCGTLFRDGNLGALLTRFLKPIIFKMDLVDEMLQDNGHDLVAKCKSPYKEFKDLLPRDLALKMAEKEDELNKEKEAKTQSIQAKRMERGQRLTELQNQIEKEKAAQQCFQAEEKKEMDQVALWFNQEKERLELQLEPNIRDFVRSETQRLGSVSTYQRQYDAEPDPLNRKRIAFLGALQDDPFCCYKYALSLENTHSHYELYLTKAASHGNDHAQNELGYFYSNTLKDKTRCIQWYEQAAAQGNYAAIYNLSHMYWKRKEYDKSFLYGTQAVGHPKCDGDGFHHMGYLYEHGQGCKKDLHAAIQWYLKGVQLKDANCMDSLKDLVDQMKENMDQT